MTRELVYVVAVVVGFGWLASIVKHWGRGHRIATSRQRLVVLWLDGWRCVECRRWLPFRNDDIDHMRAWSRGGRTSIVNMAAMCQKCNLSKGAKAYPGLGARVWSARVMRVAAVLVIATVAVTVAPSTLK